MSLSELFAVAALGLGLFFYIFGIIGMVRFPDVYARIHAAGKVSSMGIIFFALTLALLNPATTLKAIMLAVFMVITQPVASHAIASAAQRSGVPLANAARNDLVDQKTLAESADVSPS